MHYGLKYIQTFKKKQIRSHEELRGGQN